MSPNEADMNMLSMDALADAAACLKIMAHPVRLRIVDVLMQGDFPVREIAEMCGVKQHQACEHLRLMQGCGLLKSERRGQSVYYKIASQQLPSLLNCIRKHCGVLELDEETRKRLSNEQ
ncbi:MAG: metalloregulator ArsR/SmtB family transcription factor [Armatimonadota bacterium]|nr:metalloregulator ArsR/SmtB family transcription factor [bacterium]